MESRQNVQYFLCVFLKFSELQGRVLVKFSNCCQIFCSLTFSASQNVLWEYFDCYFSAFAFVLEGFFVVRLQQSNEMPVIKDPDPLINCDLMDGRDAFLTLSRDKHYEFSSLRRAKYSTMGLLYELHTQAKDGFIYTCNGCKANVETRYHCVVCDVSFNII